MNARSPIVPLLVVLLSVSTAPALIGQKPAGFGESPSRDLVLPSFADTDISQLVATLDSLLPKSSSVKWADDARLTLWNFGRRLQAGQMSASQEATVLEHLSDIERLYPQGAATVDSSRRMVSALTVGKTAPDIVGPDLDGVPFRLSDYRGKVVVLRFSGEWCGICRSEYPYERLLSELYANWPLAIVGVNSDSDPQLAKKAKADQRLTYRSFWDGSGAKNTEGPIAAAWNVMGWPTVYVLDAQGTIRFVDLRQEDLIKGVRQLLIEQVDRDARNSRK